MTPEEATSLHAQLAKGDGDALQSLLEIVRDAEQSAPFLPSLLKGISALQSAGERDYGVALYALTKIAAHTPVSPEPFLIAFDWYPNSNESEAALSGCKAILRNLASRGDRAGFDALCKRLDGLGQLHFMKATIDAIQWP